MYLQNVRVHINMKFKKFQQTQRFGSMINIQTYFDNRFNTSLQIDYDNNEA